jgi:excisionase family DNA binding protein
MRELLTVNDLANWLNVKRSTLYQWVSLGQIPAIRLNGALRFDPKEISEWLESCKISPNTSYNFDIQARGPRKGG